MADRAWATAIVLCASIACAHADSPLLPPFTHRETSPNGQFVAVSDPNSGTRVIEAASGKQLWAIPGWYRDIYLSNDGRHLAIGYDGLNLIPLNADESFELITFLDRGRKLRTVSLHAIVPDKTLLRRTVSHYAWGSITGIDKNNRLVVTRIDGREFRFNMATGEAE